MGVTKEQAAQNREQILDSAERLFRMRGVDAVGLSEVMASAGFTQGGFYNHFSSKSALVNEVMERALQSGANDMDAAVAKSEAAGIDALARQLEWYLAPAQRDDLACGCPLVAFATDACRLEGKPVKSYKQVLDHTYDVFQRLIQEREPGIPATDAREKAIAVFSMMAGAVMLSRAIESDDRKLADEVLQKTKTFGLSAIGVRRDRKRASRYAADNH